jgi:rhamnulose-1-phosphate aldolase
VTISKPTSIEDVLGSMGAAGQRLNELDAIEAGAGNASACFSWDAELSRYFPATREIELPWQVPHLAGYTVLVTGTGCRLRELSEDPVGNMGAVVIHSDGVSGTLHFLDTGNFVAPTSEFNSHLAVHDDQVARRQPSFHALIHAQPPYVVQLSHMQEYASTEAFTRAILGWEPETLVQLPEGIAFLPFMVPGSRELMESNVRELRDHQVAVWAMHGLMARSDSSPLGACDKIEYVETGAAYEYRHLVLGRQGERLSPDQLRRVAEAFEVPTDLFPWPAGNAET